MNFPAAGKLIEKIRINKITREVRGGRPFIVKRRRRIALPFICIANLFFRLARNPAFVCARPGDWQRWESGCFQLLHGDRFRAKIEGRRTVHAEVLPGRSLVAHLDAGTFSGAMVAASARELRRAHDLQSSQFHGAWSHGDPNLTNFLYDTAEQRARLIDFEIIHERTLSAGERHAADILVFLQDLLGCVSEQDWLPFARLFLETYGNDEVLPFVKQQLVIPRGPVPRLWWWIRTNYVSARVLRTRVQALLNALE